MERYVYTQLVEGLFLRALGSRLNEDARSQLRATGIDIDTKLKDKYPSEDFLRGQEIVARAVYPHLALQDAYYQMGLDMVQGLTDTLIGRAAAAVARIVGPRRAMMRVAASTETSTSFTKASSKELSPTSVEMIFDNYDGHEAFSRGCFMGALRVMRAKNPQCAVTLHDKAKEHLQMLISWDA